MAVLLEAISVVVRLDAIHSKLKGGWSAFVQAVPNATLCSDEELARVGFMAGTDAGAFIQILEGLGLVFAQDGAAVDLAFVDQLKGPAVPCPWLKLTRIDQPDRGILLVGWLVNPDAASIGRDDVKFAAPPGWKYEGSLSQKPGFIPNEDIQENLEYLRTENGVEVYLNRQTGREVYLGRISKSGLPDLVTQKQLEDIVDEALVLEAKADQARAAGDEVEGDKACKRLLELLPWVEELCEHAARESAFAHFAAGLVLRILHRYGEAEVQLKESIRLQPGLTGPLLELTWCLGAEGKTAEALEAARQAVQCSPQSGTTWGNLAMCLIREGRRGEAYRAILKAVELEPDDPKNRSILTNFDRYFDSQ